MLTLRKAILSRAFGILLLFFLTACINTVSRASDPGEIPKTVETDSLVGLNLPIADTDKEKGVQLYKSVEKLKLSEIRFHPNTCYLCLIENHVLHSESLIISPKSYKETSKKYSSTSKDYKIFRIASSTSGDGREESLLVPNLDVELFRISTKGKSTTYSIPALGLGFTETRYEFGKIYDMGGLNIRKTNYGYSLLHSLHHSDKALYQYSFNVDNYGNIIVSLDYVFDSFKELSPLRFLKGF